MANPMLMRALDEVRRFLMPSRGIIMWSGTAADIPTGWALCDGTGGTPDLTDRFILGAGKTYQPGATGGAATATPSVAAGSAHAGIAVQNAALSIWTGAAGTGIGIQYTTLDGNTLPVHAHGITAGEGGNGGMWGLWQKDWPTQKNATTYNTGASWGHTHGVSDPGHAHAVGSSEHSHGLTDGGHTHTLTAQAMSTLPPYYALCFIMKL